MTYTYTAEISRVNPSCFLFLIDQSGSMSDPFAGDASKKKADEVAKIINRWLQDLVLRCAKSEGVRDYFHVGVIGYGANVGPAFSGSLAGRELVPISEIANAPARIDEMTRKVDDGAGGLVEQRVKLPIWFDPVANGETPMCQALRQAQSILQRWVSEHPNCYPPTVIHITDGEATDGDPTNVAESIKNLAVTDGNVLLFNAHVSAHRAQPILFCASEEGLPDQYARLLFRMSSVLPEHIRREAAREGYAIAHNSRGYAFNLDLVELIRWLDIGTRTSSLR